MKAVSCLRVGFPIYRFNTPAEKVEIIFRKVISGPELSDCLSIICLWTDGDVLSKNKLLVCVDQDIYFVGIF